MSLTSSAALTIGASMPAAVLSLMALPRISSCNLSTPSQANMRYFTMETHLLPPSGTKWIMFAKCKTLKRVIVFFRSPSAVVSNATRLSGSAFMSSRDCLHWIIFIVTPSSVINTWTRGCWQFQVLAPPRPPPVFLSAAE